MGYQADPSFTLAHCFLTELEKFTNFPRHRFFNKAEIEMPLLNGGRIKGTIYKAPSSKTFIS
jgi:hypothetical protein